MSEKRKRKLVRGSTVQSLTGLSSAMIDRLEKGQMLPRRLKLGLLAVAWYEDEIDEWIDTRERSAMALGNRYHTPLDLDSLATTD
jgi:prophage regulatory protein